MVALKPRQECGCKHLSCSLRRTDTSFPFGVVRAPTSFIRLHVPQAVVKVVDVLDSDSLVDFLSVCETQIRNLQSRKWFVE